MEPLINLYSYQARYGMRLQRLTVDGTPSRGGSTPLRQQLLDGRRDGPAIRLPGEGLVCSAHHLSHVLDGCGAHLSDDFLDLGLHFLNR